MSVIDCSKCIHCEVCGDRYANDGNTGECSYFLEHNLSDDCISREALKEIISNVVAEERKEDAIWAAGLRYALTLIDSAQAISLPNEQIISNIPKDYLYDTETSEYHVYRNKYTGKEIHIVKNPPAYILDKRPQGEWINREAVSNTIFPFWERYECNQCHKFNGYSNFCPNCGAEMKGGAE